MSFRWWIRAQIKSQIIKSIIISTKAKNSNAATRSAHSQHAAHHFRLRWRRKPHVRTRKEKCFGTKVTGPGQPKSSTLYRHRTTNISVLGPPATHHVESKARRHGCLSFRLPPYWNQVCPSESFSLNFKEELKANGKNEYIREQAYLSRKKKF